MEILKKITVAACMLLTTTAVLSQTDKELQKAFSTSYTAEGKANYNTAISALNAVYNEKSYELNLRMGWLFYLSKNYTSSASYYLKAINLKSNSIEAKLGYVKPLSTLESWDKVVEQYESILKIDPQNTQANYWLGVINYNRKKYDVASQYFRKVINLYPFDYDANHMLGWTFLMTGKKEDAKAMFSRALLIKPGDTSASEGLDKAR
jgi:tetratricopeptide (TPR) repeat protein